MVVTQHFQVAYQKLGLFPTYFLDVHLIFSFSLGLGSYIDKHVNDDVDSAVLLP